MTQVRTQNLLFKRHRKVLMIPTGTVAFVVEVIRSKSPNMDLNKEAKQHCPLCHEEKKLKELRGHVGQHILWRSLGIKEDLAVKVGFCPL